MYLCIISQELKKNIYQHVLFAFILKSNLDGLMKWCFKILFH